MTHSDRREQIPSAASATNGSTIGRPGLIRRLKNHLRQFAWLHRLYANSRFLGHAVREGFWKASFSLSGRGDRAAQQQQVLTYAVSLPACETVEEMLKWLRQRGVQAEEGRHAIYIPPQGALAELMPAVVCAYPPDSGVKLLKDFRPPESAHYLTGPSRRMKVRVRMTGTPAQQLVSANLLHKLGLGPRVWDVCRLEGNGASFTAFVVQHVAGEMPTDDQWRQFIERLDAATGSSDLRVTLPDWREDRDFAAPHCNSNLIQPPGGKPAQYVDFQNFSLPHPSQWTQRIVEQAEDTLHFGDSRLYRKQKYLYQSIPGMGMAGKRNISKRWLYLDREFARAGISLEKRLVLDIGCNAGMILNSALISGAAWGLGWDLPDVARQAEDLLLSLGSTRQTITGAQLSLDYPLEEDVPRFLREGLSESIVFYLSVVQHIGVMKALRRIPWRALIFEGHQGESLQDLPAVLAPLLNDRVQIAAQTYMGDGDSGRRPLAILLRG